MKSLIKTVFVIFVFLVFSCKKRGYLINELRSDNNRKIFNLENTESNYLIYTEDFMDESWSKFHVKVRNNATLDPNGNPTADLVDFSEDISNSRISQVVDNLPEGYYAFSIYLKALKGDIGKFIISVKSRGNKEEWRNRSIKIEDSHWKRVDVRIKLDSVGSIVIYPGNRLVNGSDKSLKRIYMWGAQLEKINSISSELKKYKGVKVIK
ncbi:phage head spike fiber domain-containing protein [Gaetbulibacter aestuarii]|uniref:Uncharacterized protein n=1 Tax=Gaetbulibacter aestuarii TaxID=1502358 RepID=A0ABW7MV85_9FLAO